MTNTNKCGEGISQILGRGGFHEGKKEEEDKVRETTTKMREVHVMDKVREATLKCSMCMPYQKLTNLTSRTA
jgi:hypothetical protein